MRPGDWHPDQKPPARHDHVGHMTFTITTARCNECGQTWHRGNR